MTDRILVTGATGAVGAYMVAELIQRQANFRVAVRHPAQFSARTAAPLDVVGFDFADPATYAPALQGVSKLFPVTPPPSLHPQELNLCAPLIDAAARTGLAHLVRLSSMWALHAPASSPRQVERYIEAAGIPFTHLRPNIFMQNFNLSQRATIQTDRCLRVSAGQGRVSFIDIRDLAACAAIVLTTPGHINRAYTLTGPASLGYAEVAAALSQVLGHSITYQALSDAELRASLRAAHWPADLIDYVCHLYQAVEQGHRQEVFSDLTDLLQQPSIPFARYAHDHTSYWR